MHTIFGMTLTAEEWFHTFFPFFTADDFMADWDHQEETYFEYVSRYIDDLPELYPDTNFTDADLDQLEAAFNEYIDNHLVGV